jgi:hypothetical protein
MNIGCADITSENGSDDKTTPQAAYVSISRNGTDLPVTSIFNPLVIGAKVNTRTIYPSSISVTCDKKASFTVWQHRNPALLKGETFVTMGHGSFVQSDSPQTVTGGVVGSAATVSGMRRVGVLNVQANGSATLNFNDKSVVFDLVRGDYLTITVTTTVGLCDVVINWGEAV